MPIFLATDFCSSVRGGNCPAGTLAASFRSSLPARHPSITISICLLDDLGYRAGADGVAAFADGEAQTLLQRYRRDHRHFAAYLVAPPHPFHPFPHPPTA